MEQIVKGPNQSNGGMYADPNMDPNKEYMKFGTTTPTKSKAPRSESRLFTSEMMDVFLYGKRKIQGIDVDEAKRQKTAKDSYDRKNEKDFNGFPVWCETCRTHHTGSCHAHEPLKILRQLVGTTFHNIKLTYAVLSFPPEVQLCTSSIPGINYGVCARQPFPVGTWIGPYEGKRVKAEEIKTDSDSSYVWEIYEDGKFSHYLDGNDEKSSSWMRFIRCARHKGEQNMVVFQYGNNIYYRAVRDIPAGTELLVWYNNNYTQFLGVPLGLRSVPGGKKVQEIISSDQRTSKAQPTSPMKQDAVKPVTNEQSLENNGKVSNGKQSEAVYSSRQMQTKTTYCYTGANPAFQPPPMKFLNEVPAKGYNLANPTATIEHHPSVTNAATSRNHVTSLDNSQRAQFVPPYSGPSPIPSTQTDPNNNYFMFSTTNQPPPATSTTSVSIFPDDRVGPRDETNSWKCNQCQKTFNQRLLFQMHMCCNSPDKPYQCGHCSDSFSQPSELRSHVISHSTDRPFKCGVCGRSFAGSATLNNHMRTHTGERPFLCQNCGRTFSIATQLSRHMRTPGECPMAQNLSEYNGDVGTPFTSTLTRG